MGFALDGPKIIEVEQGQSVSAQYFALALSRPYRGVQFSVSSVDAGLTATFNPDRGNPTFQSTLTLTASPDMTPDNDYEITVRARDSKSSKTMSTSIFVVSRSQVTPPPGVSAPVLSSLSPSSATAGDSGFTLQINGTGFVSGATAFWNGTSRSTSFVNSTRIDATILTADLVSAGTPSVTATNPSSAASNALTFTINAAGFTADVWVAKAADGGSDSNDGLAETVGGGHGPKLTISAGYSVLSGLGVNKKMAVKAGTYNENINHSPPSGSSGNLNQVVAYPSQTVIFDATNNNAIVGSSYLYFERIIFNNGHNLTSDSHHCTFYQCEFRNSSGQGLQINPTGGAHQFNYCSMHDNGAGTTFGPPHGVYCKTDNNIFDHCDLYNNGRTGSTGEGSSFAFHFYDSGSSDVHDNIVRYCTIHNQNGDGTGSGGAILMSDGANNLVYNNLIYNNPGNGIWTFGGTTGDKFYNNTIYSNNVGEQIDSSSVSNWTNNIVYLNSTNRSDGSGGNAVFTTDEASGTNPQFQSPGTADFHLTASTPDSMRNSGTSLSSTFTDDYEGTARPQGTGWSKGAYERA